MNSFPQSGFEVALLLRPLKKTLIDWLIDWQSHTLSHTNAHTTESMNLVSSSCLHQLLVYRRCLTFAVLMALNIVFNLFQKNHSTWKLAVSRRVHVDAMWLHAAPRILLTQCNWKVVISFQLRHKWNNSLPGFTLMLLESRVRYCLYVSHYIALLTHPFKCSCLFFYIYTQLS